MRNFKMALIFYCVGKTFRRFISYLKSKYSVLVRCRKYTIFVIFLEQFLQFRKYAIYGNGSYVPNQFFKYPRRLHISKCPRSAAIALAFTMPTQWPFTPPLFFFNFKKLV